MSPMTKLLIATAAFLAAHFISSTPLRARLIKALGNNGYLVLYSAAAVATLIPMIFAYYRAPFIGLWHVPALRYVPLVMMPAAMVLIAASLMTRNPTLVGQERLLKADDPARGILRITRHPMMWGIALWAAAHVLARGDAASLVFFGGFLALALSGTALIDRRKQVALGADWQRFAAVTSNVPFAAIAARRNRFSAAEIGWARLLAGLALYALVLWLHPMVFGARPY
ncbi:MAG: hypothetical protein A3G24_09485 [Betaproteobacteria bacterium RIFCSPLOWO2_12_FULL_62_13]|nr:MAG: hypothetical protein A3G24_09485 [Betaproteobacteria bacterium RIFCSPLOWO2_12_FULL_62_13]